MDAPLYRSADARTGVRTVGHAVGVIVLAFAIGVIGALLVGRALFGPDVFGSENLPPDVSITLTVVQFVGFIAVAVGYVRYRGIELFGHRTPTLRDIGWIVGGLVTLFGSVFVIGFLLQFFGIESAQNSVVEAGRANPEFFLYMVPVAILLIGPGEELVFRGVVQGLFKQAYGVVPAVLITSALFGAAHLLALSGSGSSIVTTIAVISALGLVLGVVYELSENIVVPSIVHGVYNAILFLGNWVIETQDIPREAMVLFPWLF